MFERIRQSSPLARLFRFTDVRVLKAVLPAWAIRLLRRLRELGRAGHRLRFASPRARREAALQELQALPARPKISLVMPTYKTETRYLREAVASVLDQIYPEWELCIVDDGSGDPALVREIAALAAGDGRIQFKAVEENRGISAASNDGLAMSTGEFVGFLDHDDTLTPDALLRVAQALTADPETDVVYSDSDKLTVKGIRADPFLKPDWSPVYALGAMYIGHLLVVRRSVALAAGGFDSAFDTIQDFEFMLRVSERTERIHHIPQILYHWRAIPGSIAAGTDQKDGVPDLQAKAVTDHLARLGAPAKAIPHETIPHRAVLAPTNGSAPAPRVSIVIGPARDRRALARVEGSIAAHSSYPDYEVILAEGETRSRANNRGAGEAGGEYLLFVSPETEVVNADWIEQLVLHAALPSVGAVGAALVRPDGRVEEAGVAVGLRDPASPMLAGFSADGDGYYGSMPCAREVSALSAACLLVARSVFEEEGGFNELYSGEYEDFDLCMRLSKRDLKCVYAPGARLLTHRSEAERRARTDIVDRALFVDTWYDELLLGDPYFNPSFARRQADYIPAGWREPVYRAAAPLGMR
jgi:GT2 family glycosyltransferase